MPPGTRGAWDEGYEGYEVKCYKRDRKNPKIGGIVKPTMTQRGEGKPFSFKKFMMVLLKYTIDYL